MSELPGLARRCRHLSASDEAWLQTPGSDPIPTTVWLCGWASKLDLDHAPAWVHRIIGGSAIQPAKDCVLCPGFERRPIV